MKKTTALATVLLLEVATGCGKSPIKTTPPPQETTTPPSQQQDIRPHSERSTTPIPSSYLPVTWKIKLITQCDDTNKSNNCVGAYGFSITSSGNFKVGPGPDGQLLDGKITDEEMKLLKKQIATIQDHLIRPGISEPNPDCVANENSNDDSLLELNYRDTHQVKIKKSKSEICYNSINSSEATNLHSTVNTILKKYYPAPFPNDCINASQSLEKVYKSIKECEKDSDCSYIGHDFLPIDSDSNEDFIADDCTFIKPMLVANSFSAVTNQLKLLNLRELAASVCGKDTKRVSCSEPKMIRTKKIDPVCHRGVCTVSPIVKAKHFN